MQKCVVLEHKQCIHTYTRQDLLSIIGSVINCKVLSQLSPDTVYSVRLNRLGKENTRCCKRRGTAEKCKYFENYHRIKGLFYQITNRSNADKGCKINNEYPQIETFLETQTRKQRRPFRTCINKNNLIELTSTEKENTNWIGLAVINARSVTNK